MPPEQIVQTMRGMAGTQLNRELVQHFLAILPVFPVGIEVRITQGRLKGYRGVVSQVNARAMDRPVVRVMYDERDHRIQAFDYDLLKEKQAAVAATLSAAALAVAS
jgi:hypothetical protein